MGGQKRVTLLGRYVAPPPNPPGGLLEGEHGIPGALQGERHAFVGVRDHNGRGDHVHLQERRQVQPQHARIGARGWIGVIGNNIGLQIRYIVSGARAALPMSIPGDFVCCTTSAQSLSRMFFPYKRYASSVGGCGIDL